MSATMGKAHKVFLQELMKHPAGRAFIQTQLRTGQKWGWLNQAVQSVTNAVHQTFVKPVVRINILWSLFIFVESFLW
jgi:hypothetical protein